MRDVVLNSKTCRIGFCPVTKQENSQNLEIKCLSCLINATHANENQNCKSSVYRDPPSCDDLLSINWSTVGRSTTTAPSDGKVYNGPFATAMNLLSVRSRTEKSRVLLKALRKILQRHAGNQERSSKNFHHADNGRSCSHFLAKSKGVPPD